MKVIKFSFFLMAILSTSACVDKEKEKSFSDAVEINQDPVDSEKVVSSDAADFSINGINFDLPGEYKVIYDRDDVKDSIKIKKLFVESLERKSDEVRGDLIKAAEHNGCSLRKEVAGDNRTTLDFSCPAGRFTALVRSRNTNGKSVDADKVFGVIQISYRRGE